MPHRGPNYPLIPEFLMKLVKLIATLALASFAATLVYAQADKKADDKDKSAPMSESKDKDKAKDASNDKDKAGAGATTKKDDKKEDKKEPK
jgi:Ni/Co efflux regulator RcnB